MFTTGWMSVGELAITPRIWLVAVCCSAAWPSSRACVAIVFSFVAIVFFSSEIDSTRDAVLDFFERFLGVVAIETETGRPSQTWPDRYRPACVLRQAFYVVKESPRCGARHHIRLDPLIFTQWTISDSMSLTGQDARRFSKDCWIFSAPPQSTLGWPLLQCVVQATE